MLVRNDGCGRGIREVANKQVELVHICMEIH